MTRSDKAELPLLSVVIPAYNEQALLQDNLVRIVDYLRGLEGEFRWEIVIVNDGSNDNTSSIVDAFASQYDSVIALHHPRNFGLGQALKFGFNNTRGDFVVTLDVDLSYDVDHIGELARAVRDKHAKIVMASPYMKGGTISNVPWHRRILSILGNRFLSLFVKGRFSTLTSMMRAYDGRFIRALDLRSTGMNVIPETVYKSLVLRAIIEEIPARLDWGPQLQFENRTSSMRIIAHVFGTIMSGFIFRPFLFFIVPGILLAMFSAYVNFWMFLHYFDALEQVRLVDATSSWGDGLALAYQQYPHTFIFGLLTAMLAIQLIGLGILALQSKRYFEDLFHLGSSSLRRPVREAKQYPSSDREVM